MNRPPATPEEREAHGLSLISQYREATRMDHVTSTVPKADVYDPQTREWKPMSQSLGEPFDTMDETPGSPFYDKTLNFLWTQMDRMVGNIARTSDKIRKLQEQNDAADKELADARAIFLTEFNSRDVRDPDTGEIVEAPFGGK